jgi:hypothetical protein
VIPKSDNQVAIDISQLLQDDNWSAAAQKSLRPQQAGFCWMGECTVGAKTGARRNSRGREQTCAHRLGHQATRRTNWPTWFPHMPQPPLPAVFGLDPAGEIAAVGRQVHGLKPGDRVYINPGRSSGTCRHCRRGDSTPINGHYKTGPVGPFGANSRNRGCKPL